MRDLTRKEQQFLNDMNGWARHYDAPSIEFLPAETFPIREDRVLFKATLEWLAFLRNPDVFIRDDAAIKRHRPLPGKPITAQEGYRGLATFAAGQVVLHFAPIYGWVIEFDFDLGSPAALKVAFLRENKRDVWHMVKGIGGAALHLGEYIGYRAPQLVGKSQARTNPFVVRRWLKARGIEVEKA